MTVNPKGTVRALLAAGLIAAASLSSAQVTSPQRARVVSLEKGATLEQAAAALQSATGGAVLAEIPQVPRALKEPLRSAPVYEAVGEICRSFDLFWACRPGSLALQRRYTDGKETTDLEIEELAGISADIFRLLYSFAPIRTDVGSAPNQRAFLATLTPDQLAAAKGREGLPFAGLNAAQQKLWLEINTTHHYEEVNLEIERAARVFAGWKQCRLVAGRFVGKGDVLWLHYPDRQAQDGLTSANFALIPMDPRKPAGEPKPAGRDLPAPPRKPPSGWGAKVKMENGRVTLAQIAAALSTATGVKVEVPPHTRNRRVIVAATGASAGELAGAVECLWNWSLRPRLGKDWVLARVQDPRPAGNPVELWEKLRAALPPAAEHLWKPSPDVMSDRGIRLSWQVGPLLKQIEQQAGSLSGPIVVGQLKPETQKILANLALDKQGPSLDDVAYRPQVPAWLQTPERGWFTLSGSPGESGQLVFRARDARDRVWEWGWGWGPPTGVKPDTGIRRPPPP